MTATVNIYGRSENELRFLAKRHNVKQGSIVRAILEDMIDKGELEKRVASIDVQEVDKRKHGRRGKYVVNGKRISAVALAKETGLHPTTIASRLERGWDIEKAISTPPRSRPPFTATLQGREG